MAEEEIPADVIEAAKARDDRLHAVDLAARIEAELRDSPSWRLIIAHAERERMEAARALETISCHDWQEIERLQSVIRRARSMGEWLQQAINAGIAAEESIRADDAGFYEETGDE